MVRKVHARSADRSGRPHPGQRPSGVRRRRHRLRAADLSAVPPLQWWRHLPAEAFTEAHLTVVRRAISGITILSEPRWPAAARGDAQAALAIASRAMNRRATPAYAADLVMSALLPAALAGETAAVRFLMAMIERQGEAAGKEALEASWRGVTGCVWRPAPSSASSLPAASLFAASRSVSSKPATSKPVSSRPVSCRPANGLHHGGRNGQGRLARPITVGA